MKTVNLRLFIGTLLAVAFLTAAALARIHLDTDIVKYLPGQDSVMSDAGYFLKHHPAQNQIILDISLVRVDPDALVRCGQFVEQKLNESGLFKQVGMASFKAVFPILLGHILDHLPVLFTEETLRDQVQPLLAPERVRHRLREIRTDLQSLESTGQSEMIARDPLGLSDLVLARLAHLAPVDKMVFYNGRMLSPDKRHMLLMAAPMASGTDTDMARRLKKCFNSISRQLQDRYGSEATLTPLGAYRAALDNEEIVRHDVQRAILIAMAGIALLLMLAFPRPLIGLFAFLPAVAGTAMALFVFSLYHHAISIMVLGFGGAVVSITVDHGIAYLLFLDRPHETSGKAASREIWGIGLFAALTTMGAFGALCLSDFPILSQLGQFTAMGIGFSFLFVHTVFPLMFPHMPPGRDRGLFFRRLIERIASTGKKGAGAALCFGMVMLFFAWPETNVDLAAMNTVSEETYKAERLVGRVWGRSIFEKVYLLIQADSLEGLQKKGDRILNMMREDIRHGVFSSGFVASALFPGTSQQRENFADWKDFWTPDRREALTRALKTASAQLGFSATAFSPFLKAISTSTPPAKDAVIPETLFPMLSISEGTGSLWVQASSFIPGKAYEPEKTYRRYGTVGRLFDPARFSQRFGALLFSTFVRMLLIVGVSVGLLLLFFFMEWKLILITALPVVFALISTLGTLNLAGHPLDIPGLMLSIVVLGMGIDYSLFLVRSFQRYGSDRDPGYEIVRTAVFMASASTIIGFGALCFSDHSLLSSAGLTSLLGIGYAALGAFVLLPPMLKAFFRSEGVDGVGTGPLHKRVLSRYRKREAYPRFFARFKLKLDPMFSEFQAFINGSFEVGRILDIGCGYGVPGCWFLERFESAVLYGLDPDGERVRIAARVFGERGTAVPGRAPDVPVLPEPADLALLLDMIHYITDDELRLTLSRLNRGLAKNGRLVLRAAIPPKSDPSWLWRLVAIGHSIFRVPTYYRTVEQLTDMMVLSGFQVRQVMPSGSQGESTWIIADKRLSNGSEDKQNG